MLNEDSVPVWMLADSLIGVLVLGAIAGTTMLPLIATDSKDQQQQYIRSLTRNLQQTKSSLSTSRGEVQKLQKSLLRLQNDSTDLKRQFDAAAVQARELATRNSAQAGELAALREAFEKSKADVFVLQKNLESQKGLVQSQRAQIASLKHVSSAEQSVRQELLGLRGSLKRTLFVIDISGSMTNDFSRDFVRANWNPGDTAWTNVQRQVGNYLESLPVESFRIVCFNHDLHEFPLAQEEWSTDRKAAMHFLAGLTPSGLTGTEAALRKAIEYEPSSILLFTDGQPTRSVTLRSESGEERSSSEVDPSQQRSILNLIETNIIQCPVNVIALNDYASPVSLTTQNTERPDSLLSFLQEIAGRSGGAFLGY